MKSFFVSHHLQGYVAVGFVVVRFYNLSERAFPDYFEDFVAVRYMVMRYVNVGALVVVVIGVVGVSDDSWSFVCVGSDEVDLGVVVDFEVFEGGEFVHVEFHYLVWSGHEGFGFIGRLRRWA